MSHLKSIGIDVGVIAKGLNYKVSLANTRLNSLGEFQDGAYDPVSLGNWGCGCHDVDTIGKALDVLAQFRAETLVKLAAPIATEPDSNRTEFAVSDVGREIIGIGGGAGRGLVDGDTFEISAIQGNTQFANFTHVGGGALGAGFSGVIQWVHLGVQWEFN